MSVTDEIRSYQLRLRSASDGHIKGYPVVWSTLSLDLGGFRERILPGAVTFSEDLAADFNHSPDFILGRRSAGTLTVTTDNKGVYMDVTPPETQWARDLKVSIARGDIFQGSFAFTILPGGRQITEENGEMIHTLSRILVKRVSVVSDPAYPATSIEVRNRGTLPSDPAVPLTWRERNALLRRQLDLLSIR